MEEINLPNKSERVWRPKTGDTTTADNVVQGTPVEPGVGPHPCRASSCPPVKTPGRDENDLGRFEA